MTEFEYVAKKRNLLLQLQNLEITFQEWLQKMEQLESSH